MDWLVTGTRDGKTGRWKLEADDEAGARQKAVAGGVSVQEIRRFPAAQPVAAAAAAVAAAPRRPAQPPSALESSNNSTPAGPQFPEPPDSRADSELSNPDASGPEAAAAAATTSADASQASPAGPVSSPPANGPAPDATRRISLWGIAAIAAGVLGAAAAFISVANIAAIPLAAAGMLLALAGIYFSVKRKRAGLLPPVIGVLVCAVAAGLVVYFGFHNSHRGPQAVIPSTGELADRARAARIARARIRVQFVSIRPSESNKYDLTFAYNCLDNGMSVTQLFGQLRISNPAGQEIVTLSIFERFPQGLGNEPVRREDRWTLDPGTAQALEADPSQLKVEFDPLQ